jgi:hypothetical protein
MPGPDYNPWFRDSYFKSNLTSLGGEELGSSARKTDRGSVRAARSARGLRAAQSRAGAGGHRLPPTGGDGDQLVVVILVNTRSRSRRNQAVLDGNSCDTETICDL